MTSTDGPPTSRGRETRGRIVAAASVSKSQLYHYFTDKDDLVHTVVQSTIDAILVAQPHLAHLSSWAAITSWFDALVAIQVQRQVIGGCPIGGLVAQLADHDDEGRALLAAGYARWEEPLQRGLARNARIRPAAARRRPATLATATLAAIQGGLLLTQARRDPHQLRIALDAALAHLRSFQSLSGDLARY